MRVLERAALQRPGIVSGRLEMLHRPGEYRERFLPLEQLGHPDYMNRREVPGRYVGALAVPGRRDVAVGALEDEEHFVSRSEMGRNGIRTRRMPDDDELLAFAPGSWSRSSRQGTCAACGVPAAPVTSSAHPCSRMSRRTSIIDSIAYRFSTCILLF